MFWLQKSHVNWLKEGDKNTKFFHLSTLVCRRSNKLEGIKDKTGNWGTSLPLMKEVAIEYFKHLFLEKPFAHTRNLIPHLVPSLSKVCAKRLNDTVKDVEVKDSLNSIGSLKAASPDGILAIFFQNKWEVCIFDLFKLVIDCFEWGEISAAVNQTLITLIPKVPNPLEMANLRPISLCNTTYKIISKIIVARLRQHLPKFISPNQVAFVPERQIQDNIVIAQEVLHKFKTMKGKKGFFVWKIDFAKAYNKLQWGSKPLSLLQVDSLLLILWLLASSFVQCKL
ncbi:hypothetical protein ACOSQ3_008377 [Xanthoceras sorbifolium]